VPSVTRRRDLLCDSRPRPDVVAEPGRLAVQRLATAWALCFVGSQATAAPRAALAAFLAPAVDAALGGGLRNMSRRRRGARRATPSTKTPKWLAALFGALAVGALFAAEMAGLFVREYIILAARVVVVPPTAA